MYSYEEKVAWLMKLNERITSELSDRYQKDPLSTISQIRLGYYLDDITNDFVHLHQKPNLSDLSSEDLVLFVLKFVNNGVINNSLENGITNRSMGVYDLVDSICRFLTALDVTSDVMENAVNRVIQDGHNLNSELYRNIAIIKDRMINPRYAIFSRSPKHGYMVVYKGVKYYKLDHSRDYKGKDYFKSNVSGVVKYLHRQLYEDYFGKIPENHFIGFRDGDRKNVSITNLKLMKIGEQASTSKNKKLLSTALKRTYELDKLGLSEKEIDRQLVKDWIRENRSLVIRIIHELVEDDKEAINKITEDLIKEYEKHKTTA